MFIKKKSIIILLATALFSLASCERPDLAKEVDGEYRLDIDGLEETRGTASTVELNLANLSYVSSKNVSAQLKRRSGTSWVSVNDGVTYSWTASAADREKFTGSGTVSKSCTISAIAEGNGTMNVSASLNGSNVASTGIPVTVSDSRALSWTDVATPIENGSIQTATLNSNFSGTSTVSSDNGSFVVGTSSSSLSSTVSVDFSGSTSRAVYYKYTGSEDATVRLLAEASGKTAACNITAKGSDPYAGYNFPLEYWIYGVSGSGAETLLTHKVLELQPNPGSKSTIDLLELEFNDEYPTARYVLTFPIADDDREFWWETLNDAFYPTILLNNETQIFAESSEYISASDKLMIEFYPSDYTKGSTSIKIYTDTVDDGSSYFYGEIRFYNADI